MTTVSVKKSDWAEYIAVREFRDSGPRIMSHPITDLAPQARFAMGCVERWAMVSASPDGEDSAGRAKFRRLTPAELARHACDTAEAVFAEFERRGWATDTPSYAEVDGALKAVDDKN